MESESLRQEDGHLAARQRVVGAVVTSAASRCDAGVVERLDEPELRAGGRHVPEIRSRRRWAHGALPPDLSPGKHWATNPGARLLDLEDELIVHVPGQLVAERCQIVIGVPTVS